LVAKALQILDRPTRYATQEQDKLPKGYVSIRRKYPGKRLRSLSLSNGRKAKIRNIMHSSFNHAVRWEWHDRNSITLVRQSTKNIPTVLTLAEVEELLLYLEELTRTAVLVDVMTGFRVGELLALKWQDVDFEKSEIHITRSISLQHVSECKTEASRKPVPLDARLAESLRHR
jgi:integrase